MGNAASQKRKKKGAKKGTSITVTKPNGKETNVKDEWDTSTGGSEGDDGSEDDVYELRVSSDHFEIERSVGQGSFGNVYAVHHVPTGKIYAMKKMSKRKVLCSMTHFNAVWEERRVLLSVKSPFLVQLEYAFQTDTDLYLVQQLMTGGDLFNHFAQLDKKYRFIPEEWVRFYVAEIVCGLWDLHDANTLYRDLKPENCLVDAGGHVKLSDFGLCVELKESKNFMTKGLTGTRKFMAPEVLRGEPYSFAADFFSLGVTIVWMFCGHTHLRRFFEEPSVHTPASDIAKDLMLRLLRSRAHNRLGCGQDGKGLIDVMSHPWFAPVDWDAMRKHAIPPPCAPEPLDWQRDKAPNLNAYVKLNNSPSRVQPSMEDPSDGPSPALLDNPRALERLSRFGYNETATVSRREAGKSLARSPYLLPPGAAANYKDPFYGSKSPMRRKPPSDSTPLREPPPERQRAKTKLEAQQVDVNAVGYTPQRKLPPRGDDPLASGKAKKQHLAVPLPGTTPRPRPIPEVIDSRPTSQSGTPTTSMRRLLGCGTNKATEHT